MGLFSHTRQTVQPQAMFSGEISDLRERLRADARDWARQAPDSFPDGTPLPAEDLLLHLADGATRVIAVGLPDELWESMTGVGEVLRDLDSGPTDPKVVGRLLDVRVQLVGAGLEDAAEAVEAATETIGRYCAQSLGDTPFLDAAPPSDDL
ncbi:MAG: hypothetical protein ACTHOG_05415 [Marmoricola sp.]